MNADETCYPNYESHDNSPQVSGLGVAIRLAPPEGAIYAIGQPLILNGAYNGTAAMEHQTGGSQLTEVVIVIEREADGATLRRTVEEHGPGLPLEPGVVDVEDTGTRIGGYFNLNLTEFVPQLDEPGRYRVWAEFFDFKSEVLEFELAFEE
jgi:hypothetical protein